MQPVSVLAHWSAVKRSRVRGGNPNPAEMEYCVSLRESGIEPSEHRDHSQTKATTPHAFYVTVPKYDPYAHRYLGRRFRIANALLPGKVHST